MNFILKLIDTAIACVFYTAAITVPLGLYLHHTKPNSTIDNVGTEDYVIFKLCDNKLRRVKQIGILGKWYDLPK